MDFFRGLPVTVEPERDLSVKKQLLDVLLLRKEGPLNCRLPDGFENLAVYNLVTFKSLQEKLSAWKLEELMGHYVNLRKQVSPSMAEGDLLPEEHFRLYAVSARFPQQLAGQMALERVTDGVYELQVLTSRIRLIVANQLPQQEQNAMLHLFSSRAELLAYAREHYPLRSLETSTLLLQLYQKYRQEGQIMPDMLEEFARETIDRLLKELPLEKRLELIKGLSPEQRVQGLTPEELRALAEKLEGNGTPAKPE
jgi:hypothetical protein